MPPTNPILRMIHKGALAMPPVIQAYRRVREFAKHDPLVTATYRKLFERNRLTLPAIEAEKLVREPASIVLPVYHPLFAQEDAPLIDMVFLLSLAKGRQARRMLEVGTYRARTTLALHLNCPAACIVSYDIQVVDSQYRQALKGATQVELRHASFSASAEMLRKEPPYDLIFVDGSHQFNHVLEDSRLAIDLVSPAGVVVWHDYRHNDYFEKQLRVPEALDLLRRDHPLYAVAGTMCAVYLKEARRP